MGSVFIIFLSGYAKLIRADGSIKAAVIANLLSTIVNLTFDPIFIFLLHWCVKGAAMATVLGNVVGSVYLIFYIIKKSNLSIYLKDIQLSFKEAFDMFYLGFPSAASNITSGLMNTVQNLILVTYGASAVAAYGVSSKIIMVLSMVNLGIGMGIQPMLAYNVGLKNKDRINKIMKTGIKSSIFVSSILTILCIAFRHVFANVFFQQDELIQLVSRMIFFQVLACPIYGFYYMLIQYLQSIGKATVSTVLSISRQGIILIPVMLILNTLFGFNGFIVSVFVSDVLSSILSIILYNKYKN